MDTKLLAANAIVPQYDRSKLVPRLVHLGFGAFHRAHQAVYADILAQEHGSDWGYCEINLIGGEQQIADLQTARYALQRGRDVSRCLAMPGGGCSKTGAACAGRRLDAVFQALAQPEVAIVSMTITEKGYCHSPATGQLQLDHPLIVRDLANPHQPQSAVGVIVAALRSVKRPGNLRSA
ncbi:Mannitol 2-dehydrogenase [Serratia fonticola]|uniref:Mannitol 2-dehydrogenase n=1 Tax=Serratia fonticola TaxID=47917 RepID=A0A4U9WIJ4_SERFO|nr:Mannitol 2-dehydrogenase [Serratia fonticola]